MTIRLNKYLAECGVASRRGADKLISDGVVKLNGTVVTELGVSVNPEKDTVMVNDIAVTQETSIVYLMFNKPKGCITTASDERGRKTVFDYINIKERVFPIGRLDYDSEGLLLLTNDGNLANCLTHPSKEVGKTYVVKIEGEIKESELAVLRKGVVIDGVKTLKCKAKCLEYKDGISRIEMTIFEGKNRQIRKMFEAIGRELIFLKRVAVGDLRLGGLSRGSFRHLNEYEVAYLMSLTEQIAKKQQIIARKAELKKEAEERNR